MEAKERQYQAIQDVCLCKGEDMKAVSCPVCKGHGRLPMRAINTDNELARCHGCQGKGWVEVSDELKNCEIDYETQSMKSMIRDLVKEELSRILKEGLNSTELLRKVKNQEKGAKMPECYTCVCGHQRFTIYGGYVKCATCSNEFKIGCSSIEKPSIFNERIRQEELKCQS